MKNINIQVKLSGKHSVVLEKIKERPEISGTKKNTETIRRLIEDSPEWKADG